MRGKSHFGVPSVGGKSVVSVRRNSDDCITTLQLESGEILSYEDLLEEGRRGNLQGFVVQGSRSGRLLIRSDSSYKPVEEMESM